MKRIVVIYLRTSTDRQDSGLQAQKRAVEDYCKMSEINEYEIYQDRGISGTKASRPELNKMMELVINNKVKSVVVYSFSRFARSTQHLLEALELFKEHETDFISISEKIDTASPMGRAFFVIIAAISQLERELISERVKNGLKNAIAKGRYPGRPRTKQDKSILSLRGKGLTYRQIAEVLGVGHGTIFRVLNERSEKD